MRKTNATRILEELGISFETREYPVDESDLSAESVARKIGFPPEQVFKTLVVRGDKTGVLMACVPAGMDLDLKALASVSGNRRAELVPLKEVLPLTGYIRGGVSPLGGRKHYPVYLDESALGFPWISISAGLRGLQIILAPDGLVRAVDATPAPITRPAA